jgi:hypothetical protein
LKPHKKYIMFNVLKTSIALCAFVTMSSLAMAQTDSSATDGSTPAPPPTEGSTEQSSDGTVATDSTGLASPDSTGVAGASANDKPATRYKLYSGKQRGNNVIFDPKK